MNMMRDWIERVTHAVEVTGIAIIVLGAFGSLAAFAVDFVRRRGSGGGLADAFRSNLGRSNLGRSNLGRSNLGRSNLGRSILLGLEFLVAADIVGTVAIEPTLDSLAVLAGIVLIPTFLSFSLEVEIDGRWPWAGKGERPTR